MIYQKRKRKNNLLLLTWIRKIWDLGSSKSKQKHRLLQIKKRLKNLLKGMPFSKPNFFYWKSIRHLQLKGKGT